MSNRDVKYRLWDKERKVMSQPVTLNSPEYRAWRFSDDGELPLSLYGLDIDRFEWLQFTGRLDKNGKEIYEGDIAQKGHWRYGLDEHNRVWGPVSFRADESGSFFEINPFQRGETRDNGNQTFWGMSHEIDNELRGESRLLEVIGNIYQNSNLVSPASDSDSDEGKGDSVVNEQAASLA